MTLRKFTTGLIITLALSFIILPSFVAAVAPQGITVTGTPLTLDKIRELIVQVVNFLLGIGLVIGIGYIAYGAILWITSATDTKAVEGAKSTIKAALIGIAIILGFGIVVNTIDEIIQSQSFNSGGFVGPCTSSSQCPAGYYCSSSGSCVR